MHCAGALLLDACCRKHKILSEGSADLVPLLSAAMMPRLEGRSLMAGPSLAPPSQHMLPDGRLGPFTPNHHLMPPPGLHAQDALQPPPALSPLLAALPGNLLNGKILASFVNILVRPAVTSATPALLPVDDVMYAVAYFQNETCASLMYYACMACACHRAARLLRPHQPMASCCALYEVPAPIVTFLRGRRMCRGSRRGRHSRAAGQFALTAVHSTQ